MANPFTARTLSTSEQPRTFYAYYVTGDGVFPVGMMSWSSAWPGGRADAAKLLRADKRRSVQLWSYQEPNPALWAATGWTVGAEDLATGNENLVD